MAKAPQPPAARTDRRINFKALILLGVVLIIALVAYFPIRMASDGATRRSALEQAKGREEAGDIDLALKHMERYVAQWPDDLPGLKYQAKLLADTAKTQPQVLGAARANDQVLRLDPDAPDSQDVRRRVIRLYVQYGDYVRVISEAIRDPDSQNYEVRYLAAEKVARQLIARGADDAEAHRLLALALEGLYVSGNKSLIDQAIAEYQQSLKLEPGNPLATERLAELQMTAKKDPVAAAATLDALLKIDPKSVAARMTRFRFYSRHKDSVRALEELDAASALAPHDALIQATAASDAMQRQDFVGARKHLDAIALGQTDDLRVRTLKGMLELNEKHPDEAIEEWRKGLISVSGSDLELTWQLAHTLIQLGRLNESRPLVSQFRRLAGDTNEAMGRFLNALYELRGGQSGTAIKDLERVTNQVPTNWQPEVYLALGRAHESLGNQGDAMLAFQKASTLAPTAAEPRRAIARILATKSPVDAQREMDRALAQNPNDLALLVENGRMRLRQQAMLPENQRRWTEVDNIVDRAVLIDANNFAVQTLRADVLAASGRLDQALALLEKSVAGPGKKKPEIWLTYAGALDRLNRREDALRAIEQGSAADAAGDHASFRIARARLLTRINQGQAARAALSEHRDSIPRSEQPDMAHALAELCRELGDDKGARDALVDWSKQMPDSVEPGLALLAFAQARNDDQAAEYGREALRNLGGDQEPYGLAARILDLLRVGPEQGDPAQLHVAKSAPELKKLAEAEELLTKLIREAPQLPVTPMLQGMVLERRGKLDDAIVAYQRATKDGSMSPAVARLVELLARRDRREEIADLKARFEAKANADGTPSLITNFDQILVAVALRLNDVKNAEQAVSALMRNQPENLTVRVNQARLLSQMGKNREGENSLRQLANLRRTDEANWLALVAYRLQHPDLGDISKVIDEVKAGYKGPHPELLAARCRYIAGDTPGATKLYDAAVAQNGNDLTTLRAAIDFDDATGRPREAEAKLRRALTIDPRATWVGRSLALVLSARPDRAAWDEAWSLIKPGAPTAGNDPDDRLVRATVLARSPAFAQRIEAVATLKDLANDLPASNLVAVQARIRLAQSFLGNGQVKEAAQMIAPIANDSERTNPSALTIAVEAAARARDIAEATRYLDRLAALEPNSPRTAASRAWVLTAQNKPADAYRLVETAYSEIEPAPNGETLALAFQDLLTKLGDKVGAAKLAQKIAERWPKDAYVLARTLAAQGKFADAIRACQGGVEAGEVDESLRIGGMIAMQRRNDVVTIQLLDDLMTAAQAKDSKSPGVLVNIALLRHLQERYDDEIALYRAALDLKPTSFSFLNNMAWTLCEGLQEHDEALKRIDEAIRREGRAAEFLDTRGVILERLGHLNEAIADLEESLRSKPDGTTYFHLARVYRKANRPDDYRRARDQARKVGLDVNGLDPTDRADMTAVMAGG